MAELEKVIDLPSTIGKGYGAFWRFKGRYLVVKGGRASKKSTTAALKIIKLLEQYPLMNALVVRRYWNSHRNSTFAQLVWAIKRLGVEHNWNIPKSEIELTHKVTGQKILFRGTDDPDTLLSITVSVGHLNLVWCEEAYQITEEEFDKLDGSIRGYLPEGYWHQFIMTFNPWSDKIWLKRRFFDNPDRDTLAMTTNYLCNEFLSEDDYRRYEDMRQNNPRRYRIEGLGEWGVSEGLVFENWEEFEFDHDKLLLERDAYTGMPKYRAIFGLDFGWTDPTAFIAALVPYDKKDKTIYIFDEIYKTRMSPEEMVRDLTYRGYAREVIIADSARPDTIDWLKKNGLSRIKGANKGGSKGSILAGIQLLQDYKIRVHPKCQNTLVELSNYIFKKNKVTGKSEETPDDSFNHLMDALRYAAQRLKGGAISFD